jgi:hypothetical protein
MEIADGCRWRHCRLKPAEAGSAYRWPEHTWPGGLDLEPRGGTHGVRPRGRTVEARAFDLIGRSVTGRPATGAAGWRARNWRFAAAVILIQLDRRGVNQKPMTAGGIGRHASMTGLDHCPLGGGGAGRG